jgi:hypothetical protein
MLIIKGYDTRYQNKQNAEIYATFENNEKSSTYRYLNKLNTSCLGNTCKFWIEEKVSLRWIKREKQKYGK